MGSLPGEPYVILDFPDRTPDPVPLIDWNGVDPWDRAPLVLLDHADHARLSGPTPAA